MVNSLLVRYGAIPFTAAITLLAMSSSLLMYILLGIFGISILPSGMVISVIIPALVAPLCSYYLLQFFADLAVTREKLSKSESSLRHAQKIARIGNWEIDSDTGKAFFSNEYYRLFGFEPGEIEPQIRLFLSHVHPEDQQRVAAAMDATIQSSESHAIEFRILRKDGTMGYVHSIGESVAGNDRNAVRISGTLQDISIRKETEELLKRRLGYEKMLASVSSLAMKIDDIDVFLNECLTAIGLQTDVEGVFLWTYDHVNDELNNIAEWVQEGIAPKKHLLQKIPVKSVPWGMQRLMHNQVINYYDTQDIPGESERDLLNKLQIKSTIIVPLFIRQKFYGLLGLEEYHLHRHWEDEDENILRTAAHVIAKAIEGKQTEDDLKTAHEALEAKVLERTHELKEANANLQRQIAERHKTETILRKSEERFRAIVEAASDSIFIKDHRLRYILVNPAMERLFGLPAKHWYARTDTDLFGQDVGARSCEEELRVLVGNIKEVEEIKPVSGELRSFQVIKAPMYDSHGEIIGICGISRDITENRKTMEALKESEAQYRQLFNLAPTGMFEADFVNNRFVYVNDVMCTMLGYAREELLTLSPFDILSDGGKKKFSERLSKLFKGEKVSETVEFNMVGKQGQQFWALLNFRFLYIDGKIKGAKVVAQDITLRKRAEEALRLSENQLRILSGRLLNAEESERKRISRELHDGIGQMLSAIKLGVEKSLQALRNPSQQADLQAMENVVVLTGETVEEVRRIVEDLRPSMLDDLGVLATINWLCRRFNAVYSQIVINKDIRIKESDVPLPLKAVIFRIIQEAFNNIAKHSQADHINLKICDQDNAIELRIKDNGIGFDIPTALSLDGDKGGFGLASMRERAEMTNADFIINSHVHDGTEIRILWNTAGFKNGRALD